MNRNQCCILLATVLAIFCGCQDANRSKIIGTWGIQQADKVMDRVNSGDKGEILEAAPKMLLEFQSNGTLKTTTDMGSVSQIKTGTWKMDSFDTEDNVLTITSNIQMQKVTTQVTFVEDDVIELIPPNMAGLKMKLKFERQ